MKSMLLSSFWKYSISFSKRCCSPHTCMGEMAVTRAPATQLPNHFQPPPRASTGASPLNQSQATAQNLPSLSIPPQPSLHILHWPHCCPGTFPPQDLCTYCSVDLVCSYLRSPPHPASHFPHSFAQTSPSPRGLPAHPVTRSSCPSSNLDLFLRASTILRHIM